MNILILNTKSNELGNLPAAFEQAVEGDTNIVLCDTFDALIKKLQGDTPWCFLLIDYILGDGVSDGDQLIIAVREQFSDLPIVAVAESGNVSVAGDAIAAGADDFMVRTAALDDRIKTLLAKLERQIDLVDRNKRLSVQNQQLQEESHRSYSIIGNTPAIREIITRCERVAVIPRPVLITGERGTGKELVARAIHDAAFKNNEPLIVGNCAAFPDDLLESELFGHEKGAFTGADTSRVGKFELASGGTLFLDEIGNMSRPFQQKILRAVEYGRFSKVGGTGEIEVHTRIIAATNVNLQEKMDEGEFMPDLYDRLSFEIIEVPPLRERKEDIEVLANHFLVSFMREIPSLRGKVLGQTAIDVLNDHPFPGNIRELKNIIERAAYRDVTNEITPVDIGMLPPSEDLLNVDNGCTFKERMENFEKKLVLNALNVANGNQAEAARSLSLNYHQFRYFLKKYAE